MPSPPPPLDAATPLGDAPADDSAASTATGIERRGPRTRFERAVGRSGRSVVRAGRGPRTTLFGPGTKLPPDLVALARTRMRVIGLFLGVMQLIEPAIWLLSGETTFAPIRRWMPFAPIFAAVSVGVGLTAARVREGLLQNLILFYSLSISALIGWATFVLFDFTPPSAPMLTPGAGWIAIFPLIVPNDRVRVTIATLAGGFFEPILYFATYGLPAPGEYGVVWHTFYGNVAGMATALLASSLLYRLGHELERARKVGRYQLVEKLGEGGMGEVWRAKHDHLRRPAAVKLIRPGALSESARRRFEQEAQLTAELGSPHTVAVYDFGVATDGSFYYVMELLDGVDLHRLVERDGALPEPLIRHILRQSAHSLAEAHGRGLVHRDIKPANIMLCHLGLEEEFVKVLDFGLVKAVDHDEGADLSITGDTAVPGTPAFMAPEQALRRELTSATDLYSLGCVAYWLATGEFVFDGRTPTQLLVQHAHETPRRPNERRAALPKRRAAEPARAEDCAARVESLKPLSDGLDALIVSLLAKDPSRRPSASELVELLG